MKNQLPRRSGRLSVLQRMVLLIAVPTAFSSHARPDMTPLGPSIADKGSAFYHFSVSTFDSVDGRRHYKVWTAVPDKAPPASGYPVLYLLDGNAVMDRLSEPVLEKLSAGSPPVLVAVGYQTPLPFDRLARSLDYTPAHRQEGGREQLHNSRGRETGGSVPFRQLLETTIIPHAEKDLPVNGRRRALWGHSYGGLFVLESWLLSSRFTCYFSASPSVGQGWFSLLTAMQQKAQGSSGPRPLWVMEGDGDPQRPRHTATPDVLTAVRSALDTMRTNGVPASYRLYPGLSHGQMFTASLNSTLLLMSASPQSCSLHSSPRTEDRSL